MPSNSFRSACALAAALLCLAPSAARAQAAPGVTVTQLYSFGGISFDATHPGAPLTQGRDGSFYGTTTEGGISIAGGAAYRITPSGVETTLHSFDLGDDATNPTTGLLLDSDGTFYGTNFNGGLNATGSIYTMDRAGTVSVLYSFPGNEYGISLGPTAPLIQGKDGNFYGTSSNSVFKLTPSGAVTTLYTFGGVANDGLEPVGGLLLASDGNFYGVTNVGGNNFNEGAVYKVTPSGQETVLYRFDEDAGDGISPIAPLIEGIDGNFYGTTPLGGNYHSVGTLFKITPSGVETVLHRFTGVGDDGAGPNGGLVLGLDGSYYGTTNGGGANGAGTVYKMTPGGTVSTIYSLEAGNSFGTGSFAGQETSSALTLGGDGYLYGVNEEGGAYSQGAVYKVNAFGLVGSGVRFDFDGDSHPDLVWRNSSTGDVSLWTMSDQQVLSYGTSLGTVDPGSGWQPVASPNATGNDCPDLLWWNSNTGELALWSTVDGQVTQYGSDFATVSDTHWRPVAAADTGGLKSTWTLVFQNDATGDIARWTMQGTSVLGTGKTIASLGPGSGWRVVAAPDLDGDGHSDLLLWNSSTGEVSYWLCDLANSRVLSYGPDIARVADTNWNLVGSEDINGDGDPDLIWWNRSTGEISRWLMNGTSVASYGGDFAQVPDTAWSPVADK